jgi:hypothetical protein
MQDYPRERRSGVLGWCKLECSGRADESRHLWWRCVPSQPPQNFCYVGVCIIIVEASLTISPVLMAVEDLGLGK